MSHALQNCPHERRPGTTVCLHCRHAERLTARATRARIFSHLMLAGAILGVIAVGVGAATAAFDSRRHADAATAPAGVMELGSTASAGAPLPAAAGATALPAASPVLVSSTIPLAPAVAVAARAPALIPVVPEGTSPLTEGMSVVRRGDTLLVQFDTELGRTRRRDKFDAIVRSTLVQIYGSAADSVLSRVAPGTLANDGDLLVELPARGIRIPTGNGATLLLWPITRPGRDGPIVMSYRAIVTP